VVPPCPPPCLPLTYSYSISPLHTTPSSSPSPVSLPHPLYPIPHPSHLSLSLSPSLSLPLSLSLSLSLCLSLSLSVSLSLPVSLSPCLSLSLSLPPSLSVSLSLSPRFAKTLRIFIIIKSGLRRIKVTAAHVLSFTACWYAVWILYLLIYTVIAAPTVLNTARVSISGQVTSVQSCSVRYPALDTLLYVVEGMFLGASAMLCYATKDVPDAINESKVITFGKKERERKSVFVLCS
jgi:7 transmembrane sweet-taste receptor of 3 GCPR